jgi:hypothetical protein
MSEIVINSDIIASIGVRVASIDAKKMKIKNDRKNKAMMNIAIEFFFEKLSDSIGELPEKLETIENSIDESMCHVDKSTVIESIKYSFFARQSENELCIGCAYSFVVETDQKIRDNPRYKIICDQLFDVGVILNFDNDLDEYEEQPHNCSFFFNIVI